MSNKIASIILNSGRSEDYAGEAYVSQPETHKERLAGKIFVLAEMSAKKSEAQKIISFLANVFEYNYYGDEKISLREKLDDLEVEDIFESVLAKVNQALVDFLEEERLRLNPETTNLTLGVIHNNKLYFSTYGRNKAFLIYRRQGDYEIINVEMVAKDGGSVTAQPELDEDGAPLDPPVTKIFSSVVNGEIPPYSYFLFTNEALPEYLSHGEMANIITKLPPMVAAEQIKNFLKSVNSFAPFLGIIIKSNIGGIVAENYDRTEDQAAPRQLADNYPTRQAPTRKAQSSISHLNYTEQKTEKMLSSAGAISIKGLIRGVKNLLGRLKAPIKEKKAILTYQEDGTAVTPIPKEKNRLNLPRRDSFLIKTKVYFKKSPQVDKKKVKSFFKRLLIIFTPSFWTNLFGALSAWLRSVNRQHKLMMLAGLILVITLSFSLAIRSRNNEREEQDNQFLAAATSIREKQGDIFRYAAVDNINAALGVLGQALIDLEQTAPYSEEKIAEKEALKQELLAENDRIQKIVRINEPEEIFNVISVEAQADAYSLTTVDGQIFVADKNQATLYTLNLENRQIDSLSLPTSAALSRPVIYEGVAYYLASSEELVAINDGEAEIININQEVAPGSSIGFYNNRLYVLDKDANQIFRYNRSGNSFGSRTNWARGDNDFSDASDIGIDGDIYVAQENGDLMRYRLNERQTDYKSTALDPAIRADRLIVTDNNNYLLDSRHQRLVVLNKGGGLEKQYLFDRPVSDFTLGEDGQTIFILSGNKVFKFSK
ncbi:MAG: hypothetical protein JST_000323 [Candidatus Parcubacteria bacterium]|nr:MAG: hypothetical protein JST_2950 [Candidatus Parcubacteria bacterium]